MSSTEVVQGGVIYAKLPKEKRWSLLYVELTSSPELQLYECRDGEGASAAKKGSQLRSLKIDSKVNVSEEKSRKNKDFKFCLKRIDGSYYFKCSTAGEREEWILQLQRAVMEEGPFSKFPTAQTCVSPAAPTCALGFYALLNSEGATSPPPTGSDPDLSGSSSFGVTSKPSVYAMPPSNQPYNASPILAKYGTSPLSPSPVPTPTPTFGPSPVSTPTPPEQFLLPSQDTPTPTASPLLSRRATFPPDTFPDHLPAPSRLSFPAEVLTGVDREAWFWGGLNRDQCQQKLYQEGHKGEYVIRINDRGEFVMSVWRNDGKIHHHIIGWDGDKRMLSFKGKSNVIEASTLPELLRHYPEVSTNKIIAFGSTVEDEEEDRPDNDPDYMTIPEVGSEMYQHISQPPVPIRLEPSPPPLPPLNPVHRSASLQNISPLHESPGQAPPKKAPPPIRPKPLHRPLTPDLRRRNDLGQPILRGQPLVRSQSLSLQDVRQSPFTRQKHGTQGGTLPVVAGLQHTSQYAAKSTHPLVSTKHSSDVTRVAPGLLDVPSTETAMNTNPDYANSAALRQSSLTDPATAVTSDLLTEPTLQPPQYGGYQAPTLQPLQYGGSPQYGSQASTLHPQGQATTLQLPQYGGSPQYGGQAPTQQPPQYGGQAPTLQPPQYGGYQAPTLQPLQYGGSPQYESQASTLHPQGQATTLQLPQYGGSPQYGGQAPTLQPPQYGGSQIPTLQPPQDGASDEDIYVNMFPPHDTYVNMLPAATAVAAVKHGAGKRL